MPSVEGKQVPRGRKSEVGCEVARLRGDEPGAFLWFAGGKGGACGKVRACKAGDACDDSRDGEEKRLIPSAWTRPSTPCPKK